MKENLELMVTSSGLKAGVAKLAMETMRSEINCHQVSVPNEPGSTSKDECRDLTLADGFPLRAMRAVDRIMRGQQC